MFFTNQRLLSILRAGLIAALAAPAGLQAGSVSRVWNGSADGNWGTTANWTPSGAPATGSPYDSVTFSGTANLATTNNLSSLSVSNLTFAAGGFSVNGNSLIIRSSITSQAGTNVINLAATLANNPKTWYVAAGSEIDVLSNTLTATFTGSAPFEKNGAGPVRFKGTNWWAQGADISAGAAIIDGGALTITNDGFRLIGTNGAWAQLVITNGGSLTLGANSVGKSFNLKLGSTGLLTGTNELDISSGQIFLGANITQFIVGDQTGTYGIVNQNGGSILYQNASTGNDLLIANLAGAIGIYNLNGGLLQVPFITSGAKGGYSYFNFNGGTLTPYTSINASNFIQGLTALTVQNGGAIIDTTNLALAISQPLLNGGTGGLTKLGSGTLTLSGASTYTGTNYITAGELIVPTIQTGGGAIIAADNTALGVTVAATATSLKAAALILGGGTGATNEFFLGASGNPSTPVITATNLAVNGTVTVNIYGAGFSVGQFSLIKYATASRLTTGSLHLNALPTGVSAFLSNNVTGGSVDLVVTSAPTIVWTGVADGNWDVATTANWYDPAGLQAVTYTDGSSVKFDDTATGTTTISLAATVAPGGVTVNNNSLTYTFTGSGAIGGSGALTKSGSGTLIAGTPNTYTGNTVINAGVLQLGTSQGLPGGVGAGNVTVNGELDLAGNTEAINGLNGSGLIDSSTGSGTLTVGANNAGGSFTGSITNTGGTLAFAKSGTGTQVLAADNGFSGGSTLSGGTLQLGTANALGTGPVSLQVPVTGVTLASYAGDLNISNQFYVFGGSGYPANFDTSAGDIILNNYLTGTGPDIFKKGYNTLRIGPAGGGYTTALLHLYQGSVVVDGGGWTNYSNGVRFYAGGSDIVRLVITNGGTFAQGFGGSSTYNIQLGYVGGLTGTNELDISSGQAIFDSTFRQIIAGNAMGTYGVVNQTGGLIYFQNVVAAATGILLGNNAGTTGAYYLNGGNLVAPRVIGGSGTSYFYFNGGTLSPASAISASSFVSALTAAYVGNGGAIIDTTNLGVTISQSLLAGGTGGLTKLGGGALVLAGTNNTYTGPTVVKAGELWLPTTQTGGGAITVADNAALGITYATNAVLATPVLTLGSSAGATNDFNFGAFSDPAGAVVLATNLVVNGTIYVDISGSSLTPGQFPLIKYGGASGLTANSFQLGSLPALTAAYLSNNVANSSIDLVVTVEPTLVWTGSADGSWEFGGSVDWINAASQLPVAYSDGAYVRFDDTATGSTTVSLSANVAPSSVVVSNSLLTYTFTGGSGITGVGGFTKDGPGAVVVAAANTYASNTVIKAGTLQLGANEVIPSGASNGNVVVNGKLDLAGFSQTVNGLAGGGVIDNSTGSGVLNVGANDSAGAYAGVIANSGGSLALVKTGTNTLALTTNSSYTGGTTLSAGSLQIGSSNALGYGPVSFSVPSNGVTLASYAPNIVLTNPISITTVSGGEYAANFDTTAGDLILSSPVTTAAADVVKLGTNSLRITAAVPSVLTTGKLLLYQGDLVFDGAVWTNYGGAIRTFAPSGGTVHVVITNNATLSVGTSGSTPNLRLGYTSNLGGTNELDISSGLLVLDVTFNQILDGDAAGTYGVVNQTGGTVLFQNITNPAAGVVLGNSAGSYGWYYLHGGSLITPAVLGGSGTGYFYFDGGILKPGLTLFTTNFVSGLTAAYVGNGGAIIDTTNLDVVVSQPLLNGGTGGLTKLGSASLTLTGTNTYAGPTLVSNGTLVVNGSLGTNVVIVSGASLAGTGVIAGVVTVNTNGTLILGSIDPLNTGTLTLSNNLTIAGGVYAKLNKSLAQSNDLAVVTGTLVNSGTGTLTLTNAGPALVAGDSFKLFNQPVANGNNLTITPAPGAGLYWQNHLAVDGSVAVVASSVATNPTNIVASVTGGVLTLSWPADHLGWRLQAQTNGLGNNWVDVPAATQANQITIPVDSSNGSVFFRLVAP